MLLRGVNTWDSCVGDLELFTHGDLELFTELFMRITDACSTHCGICLRCVSSVLFDKISGSKALNGFLGAADGQSQTYFGNNEFWHPEVSCKDLVSAEKLGRGKTQTWFCVWVMKSPEGQVSYTNGVQSGHSFHPGHSQHLLLTEVNLLCFFMLEEAVYSSLLAIFILFVKLCKWLLLGKRHLQT